MKITFTPQLNLMPYALEVHGDVLTIDGVEYDFSPLPVGGVLPQDAVDCRWLASDVVREDSEISLTLILPHGPNAPEETTFPQPIHVTEDGPVLLPIFDVEVDEEEADTVPDEIFTNGVAKPAELILRPGIEQEEVK